MRQNGTFFLLFIAFFITHTAGAQTDSIPVKDSLPIASQDTIPAVKADSVVNNSQDSIPGASVDPELMGILDAKIQKKYIIQDIKVTGARVFDFCERKSV